MNGTYNVVREQFKDTWRRENKSVKVMATGDVYDVVFRRNKNNTTTKNHSTIFYPKADKEMKQGRLLLFRNKFFLIMNQEELENDVYYRSDLVQTNCVLEALLNKSQLSGRWYADELVINSFSSDMRSTASINGSVITTLGGRLELLAEDNAYTRLISPDDNFIEFGGTYEVDNIYFLEGFARISLKQTQSSGNTTQTHILNVVQGEFFEDYEYSLSDFILPVIREFNGVTATDYIIRNSMIDVVSSDESIAKYNKDTGMIETYTEGSVTLDFTWVEHGITESLIVDVAAYAPPPPYAIISWTGLAEIRQGGSNKIITVNFSDPDGSNINDASVIQWQFSSSAGTNFVNSAAAPTAANINWSVQTPPNIIRVQAGSNVAIGSIVTIRAFMNHPVYGLIEDTVQMEIVDLW